MIKGLSHITFICRNLEKSAEFLKTVFDAKEIYHSGDKTFSISKEKFFDIAGMWIAIMEGESIHKSYNHIAFRIDAEDIPEYERRIRSLGLEILPSRPRKPEEGMSIYFYDDDNHLFELHTGDLQTRLKFYNE